MYRGYTSCWELGHVVSEAGDNYRWREEEVVEAVVGDVVTA